MRLRSLLPALMLLGSALCAGATDSLVAVVGAPVLEADIHVRADSRRWALLWNRTDSANFVRASLRRAGSDLGDDIYNFTDALVVERIAAGAVAESSRHNVSHQNRELSIRLSATPSGIRLFCGDGERIFPQGNLLGPLLPGTSIVLEADDPVKIGRLSADIVFQHPDPGAPFPDMESLADHLARSTDSVEGYWEYLDRDINAPAVQLGGFYRIALVRDGDCYRALYLGGADKNASLWKPLHTKAILRPTVFINNFDVCWIDSPRSQSLDIDVSASLADNAVLTFHFPLLESSIRFRRMLPAAVP